jgi:hypothetical protein
MTSQISNAPNIGFTHAGGFMGVTVRNSAGSYGWASGAVSSATPTSPPNTVQTVNGTPIAGFSLNNTNSNLLTGAVSNSQSSTNFIKSASSNYTFNPITAGTPTTMANNHPDLTLHGYVGGTMVTATTPLGAPPSFTTPYIVTNVTGQPGNVAILLPGNSSEMLAVFNVGSVDAPKGAMTSSNYAFGSLNAAGYTGLNGARGAYVNPTNFAGRAAAMFDGGANIPVSTRNGLAVGSANQLMVTADSVGANTISFLTSISTVPVGTSVKPCACESTRWGFWSAFNGDSSFQDQGALLLWVAGVPTSLANLPATGTATYAGHAIASIANSPTTPGSTSYLAAGTFSNMVNFKTRMGTVAINGLDGSNYGGSVALTPLTVNFGGVLNAAAGGITNGRTATLAGSFFQANPTNLFGEMGGSLMLNGTLTHPYLGSGIFAAHKQ